MARRFQFNLKSLMAAVVLICLGLGGWNWLRTNGRFVHASGDQFVLGQPIKIRGRFFHFGRANDVGGWRYELDVFPIVESGTGMGEIGSAKYVGWWRYEIESEFVPEDSPGEFTMTLTPDGGSPIRGSFVVREE